MSQPSLARMRRPMPICKLGVSGLGAEDFEEEEAGADDDAGVGDVEVGPVVVVDLYGEEVDDVVEADAVVEIAEGSAEDEGECDGGEGERSAGAPEQDEDNDGGDDGEADEADADAVGREVFEEREGRAGVEDVREAEDSGDDWDVVAGTDAVDDPVLGEAVEQDDEGGDDEEYGGAIGRVGCGLRHGLRVFGAVRGGHGDLGHCRLAAPWDGCLLLSWRGIYVAGLQPFVAYLAVYLGLRPRLVYDAPLALWVRVIRI